MKATITNLRRAVESSGGILEQDDCGRDYYVYQMVAPDGKMWKGENLQEIPVFWGKRANLPQTKRFNADALTDAIARIQFGLTDFKEL